MTQGSHTRVETKNEMHENERSWAFKLYFFSNLKIKLLKNTKQWETEHIST